MVLGPWAAWHEELASSKHLLRGALVPGIGELVRGPAGPPDAVDEFAALMEEIEERKRFLDQMRGFGKGDTYEGPIKREIAERVQRLKLLDDSLHKS